MVRMSQKVYFRLASESVTAGAISAALGIKADRYTVRGSRQESPQPIPVSHSWTVHSQDTSQPLDAQASSVLDRIAHVADTVRAMVVRGDVSASLVFVRYFNDSDGEDENLEPVVAPDGAIFEAIAGQHQLLGWHLETDQLALLAHMRATIDADEYG